MSTTKPRSSGRFGVFVIAMTLLSCSVDNRAAEPVQATGTDVAIEDLWSRPSTGGTTVSILAPEPLVVGPMSIQVHVEHGTEETLPVTLDLVSPEMPMHGILRYESQPKGGGAYIAHLDIPMEGRWELYVNLDYGADAAVFELDVSPGMAGSGHQHGAPPTRADAAEHDSDVAHHHDREPGS